VTSKDLGCRTVPLYWRDWLHGTVVERRSLAGQLPCPMLNLQLMGDNYCG